MSENRLGEIERELHTIRFRLEHMDAYRLPDRVTSMESAMSKVNSDLVELKSMTHRTNDLVNAVRAEINADLDTMAQNFFDKTADIQSSLDRLNGRIIGTIATSTVFVGAVIWFVEYFDLGRLIIKSLGQ